MLRLAAPLVMKWPVCWCDDHADSMPCSLPVIHCVSWPVGVDDVARSRSRPGAPGSLSERVLSRTMMSSKLFQKKVAFFGTKYEFNRNSVITGIIKILLKVGERCNRHHTTHTHTPIDACSATALLHARMLSQQSFTECVRLCTFSKHGYQQIQVDVEYLRVTLAKFVHERRYAEQKFHQHLRRPLAHQRHMLCSLLDSLLDEVVISTEYRCKDPSALDKQAIQTLLASVQ
jgi:hypothetical protein